MFGNKKCGKTAKSSPLACFPARSTGIAAQIQDARWDQGDCYLNNLSIDKCDVLVRFCGGIRRNMRVATVIGEDGNRGYVRRMDHQRYTFDYAYGMYADSFGEAQYPAVHKREVRFCKPSFYVVRDTLSSSDGQAYTYGLRFHMDTLDTQILDSGAVLAQYGKTWDLLLVPLADAGEVSGRFTAHVGETSPLCGWYIGRNAEKNHPATTVIQESASVHTRHFTTLLIPFRHGTALPEVTRKPDGTVTVELAGEICCVDRTHLDR